MIFRQNKEFPKHLLSVFVLLQLVDILTTLIGLGVGAHEGSVFIARLMHGGPLAALLISKLIAVCLVAMALRWHRPRVVVLLNYWLAIVVVWNLLAIGYTVLFR
jgi:hypothetical protein